MEQGPLPLEDDDATHLDLLGAALPVGFTPTN
jgi:hypothetical protein